MRVLLSPFFSVFLAMTMPALAHAQLSMAVARMQTQEYPTLLQGTPVTLLLDQTVDGEYSKVGQRVRFEVAHDVRLGDRVLIPKGVLALGTVTLATRQHFLGHAGRVSVAIAAVRLPGGQVVRLSFRPKWMRTEKAAETL